MRILGSQEMLWTDPRTEQQIIVRKDRASGLLEKYPLEQLELLLTADGSYTVVLRQFICKQCGRMTPYKREYWSRSGYCSLACKLQQEGDQRGKHPREVPAHKCLKRA